MTPPAKGTVFQWQPAHHRHLIHKMSEKERKLGASCSIKICE